MSEKIKCVASPLFMKRESLGLGDFAGQHEDKIKQYIYSEFKLAPGLLDNTDIVVAYVCDDAYESTAWFLTRDKVSGQLFEVSASHCSCYGYEEQWSPEPTTLEYLKSDKFSFSAWGTDAPEKAKLWMRANL